MAASLEQQQRHLVVRLPQLRNNAAFRPPRRRSSRVALVDARLAGPPPGTSSISCCLRPAELHLLRGNSSGRTSRIPSGAGMGGRGERDDRRRRGIGRQVSCSAGKRQSWPESAGDGNGRGGDREAGCAREISVGGWAFATQFLRLGFWAGGRVM